MWSPDDMDPDLTLIKPQDDSGSDIYPNEISQHPPQPNSPTSSQLALTRLDPPPILMRRHTLFSEDSDDETPIKIEDTNDTESSESLLSSSTAPSSQSSDYIQDLADLPHEIVERPASPSLSRPGLVVGPGCKNSCGICWKRSLFQLKMISPLHYNFEVVKRPIGILLHSPLAYRAVDFVPSSHSLDEEVNGQGV
jgi:hypothetical protein